MLVIQRSLTCQRVLFLLQRETRAETWKVRLPAPPLSAALACRCFYFAPVLPSEPAE